MKVTIDSKLLRPSKAHRWLECSISPFLEALHPEHEVSVAAQEGTLAHAIAAEDLDAFDFADLAGFEQNHPVESRMVRAVEDPELTGIVDEDMRAHARGWRDFVLEHVGPGAEIHIEKSLALDPLVPETSGTPDVVIVDREERVLYVFDYKYGRVLVDVNGNPQLAIYTFGAWDHYVRYRDSKNAANWRFVTGIYQPRIGNIETAEFGIEEIYRIEKRCQDAWTKARAGDLTAHPSEENCRFCSAKGACTARALDLFSDLAGERLGSNDLDLIMEIQRSLPDTADFSNGDFAELVPLTPALKKWADDVYSTALGIHKTNPIPGLKLVRGRAGNRAWSNPEDAQLAVELHDPDVEFFEQKAKSPAKIEKAIGKKNFALLSEYVYQPPGGIKLVSADDKRPSIDEMSPDEFENLDG